MQGRAHIFGDDINTDYIIAAKRRAQAVNPADLLPYLMEDIRPGFYQTLKAGDFIVGGDNFGCGSSREHAPLLIKEAGVSAVLAKSFARIFYRNAINLGLPVLEFDTSEISEGDELEADLSAGVVRNLTTGKEYKVRPLPPIMQQILKEGGVLPYLQKYGSFRLEA
jgi:3-isopropylmalate/(R)-2-methylmalate dehydratase small subunit